MSQLTFRHERSHTKVVATLGPASSSREVLEKLFEEGIDVCRLNFSHGSHEDHLKTIKLIKKINAENESTVAILADLQGPKLRIGDMENNGVDSIQDTLKATETFGDIYLQYQNERCNRIIVTR